MSIVLSFVGGVSLNAAVATGAGTAFACDGCKNFSMQVVLAGAPATAVVKLEGTLDGTNYFVIASWDVAAPLVSGDMVFATDKPCKKIRANCTTFTTGDGKTVTATLSAAT